MDAITKETGITDEETAYAYDSDTYLEEEMTEKEQSPKEEQNRTEVVGNFQECEELNESQATITGKLKTSEEGPGASSLQEGNILIIEQSNVNRNKDVDETQRNNGDDLLEKEVLMPGRTVPALRMSENNDGVYQTEKEGTKRTDSTFLVCVVCKELDQYSKPTKFCNKCQEAYCDDCAASHRAQKATRQHDVTDIAVNTTLFFCDTCVSGKFQQPAKASCKICRELYCDSCTKFHVGQKATRSHEIFKHDGLSERSKCEPCAYQDVDKTAMYLCVECDEVLCKKCFERHTKQKATRDHTTLLSNQHQDVFCQPCSKTGSEKLSTEFYSACQVQLSTEYATQYRISPSSADNRIIDIESSKRNTSKEEEKSTGDSPGSLLVINDDKTSHHHRTEVSKATDLNHEPNLLRPGKPHLTGERHIDLICIGWDPPEQLFYGHSFQVRYKEDMQSSKWINHTDQTSQNTINIGNLKSNTKYVFQVRMVSDDHEGPFSEVSEPVKTIKSAATDLLNFMYDVKRTDVHVPLKKVPLTEVRKARNKKERTRKLIVGQTKNSVDKTSQKERTILLIGATGTGKSTLVDGMMNYILGVNWNDEFRVTAVDLEDDEAKRDANQAVSQTQWITTYTVHPLKGSRLKYTLNIIDTPGFGDTRGIERDKEIVEQIRELFSREDESGIVFLDAVCFLIKAPDARLTPTQTYIFNAIMSLFGQDVENNFCMLVTFADGKRPPVLSALKEAKLPHEQYFPFNNSGLFAENTGDDVSGFSQMFWDMGNKSFGLFFDKLETMETKSLRQTRDVLDHRERIEINVENLQVKLDAGLMKVEELRLEIQILQDFKTTIEGNKDFTYTVDETEQRQIDLPPGKHVTNCLHCHMTCHRNCKIPNDEDKRKCKAMDRLTGDCLECPNSCNWSMHKNTPYIFEYVTVTKTKTYQEKLEKYRLAKDETMTREKVVSRMQEELIQLDEQIMELMAVINRCNNILKQIALRPDPLTVAEHIDLLIEAEKLQKRPGFQQRIAALARCRKKATIGESVEKFRSSITDTKFISARVHVPTNTKAKKGA